MKFLNQKSQWLCSSYNIAELHQFPPNSVIEFTEYLQWDRLAQFFAPPCSNLSLFMVIVRAGISFEISRPNKKVGKGFLFWSYISRFLWSLDDCIVMRIKPKNQIKTICYTSRLASESEAHKWQRLCHLGTCQSENFRSIESNYWSNRQLRFEFESHLESNQDVVVNVFNADYHRSNRRTEMCGISWFLKQYCTIAPTVL